MLALLSVSLIYGCQKTATKQDETMAKRTNEVWHIEDGRVAFSSFQAYHNLLENPDPAVKADFIDKVSKSVGFNSANENESYLTRVKATGRLQYGSDSTINEEIRMMIEGSVLGTMINQDGIVQIGDYLFNVNLATQKCYALHQNQAQASSDVAYLSLLNEDVSQNYILEFSTDDEVLEKLELMNYPKYKTDMPAGGVTERCEGTNRQGINWKENFYFDPNGTHPQIRMACKVAYQKAGIWFSLIGAMDYQHKALIGWRSSDLHTWAEMTAQYQYKYKPRCQPEMTSNGLQVYKGRPDLNGYKERPYEGGRALVKYDQEFQWYTKGKVATNYTGRWTDKMRIVSGY